MPFLGGGGQGWDDKGTELQSNIQPNFFYQYLLIILRISFFLFEFLVKRPTLPHPRPVMSGVVQGCISLGYLCKYVNQRVVRWNLWWNT